MMADDKVAQGVGRLDPTDTASAFNQHDFHIRQRINQISTNKLVKVLAVYDAEGNPVDQEGTGINGPTGFVDVQIMVNMVDGYGNAQEHGIIHKVPFSRNQGGGNGVIMDPQVGDIGVMACSDRDISSVKQSRQVGNPGGFGTLKASDGMYVGGTLNGELTQYLRFKANGLELVDKNGNKIIMAEEGIQVEDTNGNVIVLTDEGFLIEDLNGNKMQSSSDMIEVTTPTFRINGNLVVEGGTAEVTGDISANVGAGVVTLGTHIHPQGNDSHGDTEQDTGPPIPGP